MAVGLVVNIHRADAVEAARQTAAWLREKGHEVGSEVEAAETLGVLPYHRDLFPELRLVIAFGGDGTLIRAAHLISLTGVPLLGVYFGRFGFVTQAEPKTVREDLEAFFAGNLALDRRMMLEVELIRGGKTVATIHALNEMALQRAVTARMMVFEVTIDGNRLTRYPADGVVVCTPTGSTAYNLSVGGPILEPRMEAIVLTAIAPHTLNSRPLVLSPESDIELAIQEGDGDSTLSVDGRTRLHVVPKDSVRVKKSDRVTNLVSVSEHDFLKKLGQRLLWSKGLLPEDQ